MAEVFESYPRDVPPAAPQPQAPPRTPRIVLPPQGFGEDGFAYDGFGMTVSYVWDSGLRGAPLCGSARVNSVFWRLHCELTYKVIDCVASRCLLCPVMPHVDSGDVNDVLIRREMSLPAKESLADGTDRIVVAQRLVYVCQYAQELAGPILVPNSVLDLTEVRQLDPGSFLRVLNLSVPPAEAVGVNAITF